MTILRWLVWLADEALDRIPGCEDGSWYRYGQWGCRLRLHRWWGGEASKHVSRRSGG